MATGHGSMNHEEVNSVCKKLEINKSLDKTSKLSKAGSKSASGGHSTAPHAAPGKGGGGGHTRR